MSGSGQWRRAPMRGYEKQGWVEVWAERLPIITADAFQRTSHGETETHSGVRILAEALPLIEAAPELLAALEEAPREVEVRKEMDRLAEIRSHKDVCRQGNFGIAVHRDEEAIAWQALNVELEALLARRAATIAKARGGRRTPSTSPWCAHPRR